MLSEKHKNDILRASVLNRGEILQVKYVGKLANFTTGKIYDCIPRMSKHSNLPYPHPKWVACTYRVSDDDGDYMEIAEDRYGEFKIKGFEWIK